MSNLGYRTGTAKVLRDQDGRRPSVQKKREGSGAPAVPAQTPQISRRVRYRRSGTLRRFLENPDRSGVQRVFPTPENAFRQGPVDDRNRPCRLVVNPSRVRSAKNARPEILHVAGTHAIPRGTVERRCAVERNDSHRSARIQFKLLKSSCSSGEK